ncbi:MAG: hypothetical protein ABWX73_11930, partial [Marmoricola sp.]
VTAFVVLAWPALTPEREHRSSGIAAASTSLVELVPPQLPSQGAPPSAEERRTKRLLTNGCSYTLRGIPKCGVLLGAAYASNTDPLAWERSMGHPLGVRRTYWDATNVADAVATARLDLQRQRLPWISFKLPHSWEQMRDGLGDAWVRDLAGRLSQVDGPVWLAFHHEPEGDGDIRAWTAMQARLAPIVRALAPNVAYTIILTGWNQLYGDQRFSFDSIWPQDTEIDVAGFDVYDKFGVVRDGYTRNLSTDFENHYFKRFERFAEKEGVAWALAETGHTDRSASVRPDWVLRNYMSVLKYGGVAVAYFNSTLNSIAPWRLVGAKEEEFATTLRMTPTL